MGGAAKAYTTEPSDNMLNCLMRLSEIFTPLTDDLAVRNGKKLNGTLSSLQSTLQSIWSSSSQEAMTILGIRTSRLLQRSTS